MKTNIPRNKHEILNHNELILARWQAELNAKDELNKFKDSLNEAKLDYETTHEKAELEAYNQLSREFIRYNLLNNNGNKSKKDIRKPHIPYNFNRTVSLRENLNAREQACEQYFTRVAEDNLWNEAIASAKGKPYLKETIVVEPIEFMDNEETIVLRPKNLEESLESIEPTRETLGNKVRGLYDRARDYVIGQPSEIENFQPWYLRHIKGLVTAGLIGLSAIGILGDNKKENTYQPIIVGPTIESKVTSTPKIEEGITYNLPEILIEEPKSEEYKGITIRIPKPKRKGVLRDKPGITSPLDHQFLLDCVPSGKNYGKITTGREILERKKFFNLL
ncbi:MAG TPA: hypothetical protein VJB89_03595 [Candidatus Nanoarchaeia archaeon]|nr:hypothetical protein [Candidatus Nanoarchaeia archaeon]